MGNTALSDNQFVEPQADLAITTHGSDWYFAVTAIMGASTLAFMGWSFTRPRSERLFHYITSAITLTATIAYFSMGSGLGQIPIGVEFGRPDSTVVYGAGTNGTREIFYVRYIDWFVTTPLLLLDLLLTAGLPWPTILITIFADEVMIVTGLVGALTSSSYKWGYWFIGMFALFYIAYILGLVAFKHSRALGALPARTYLHCGVLTMFLWFLYPIAWGVSEGGNVIHPDSEAIFYGILDVFAKPVFGFLLLAGHQKIPSRELGIYIRDYDELPYHGGGVGGNNVSTSGRHGLGHHEKVHNNGTTTTGATTTTV